MSICVVDGKHCQCSPSEGFPCPGVVELQAKLTESALCALSADGQAHEAYAAQQRLERELAEANAIIAALKDDYNRRPENEPIGMLIDTLSTRPRNIINLELSMYFPGEVLTLRHLCQFARSEVLKFPNLGKKSLREIEEYLRPRGVWWRGEA